MADIDLAVEKPSLVGVDLVDTGSLSTSNNYRFLNNGKTVLHFKKTGAGACTVTMVTPRTVDGIAVADPTASIPATTGDRMVGPFPRETFNDENGKVNFTLSDIAGLSVAVMTIE